MTHKCSKQRGFTLIEVLVTLSIALLIGGLAYASLASFHKLQRSGEQMAEQQENQRALSLLMGLLSRAERPSQDPVQPIQFFGGAQRLQFNAALPMQHAQSGRLGNFTLYQISHTPGYQLRLRYRLKGQSHDTLISEGDMPWRLSYQDRQARWHAHWQRSELPQRLRLVQGNEQAQVRRLRYAF